MRDGWKSRWGWGVSAVVLVGGFLGTSVVTADDGKNASTNHTLRWDTNNPPTSRFITAFTGAVLDKNTGLVWEQAPDATPQPWSFVSGHVIFATYYCLNKNVGGTKGWRLPSVAELASLVDPSQGNPSLPIGHPFTNVQSAGYWSATTIAASPTSAWVVDFNFGVVGGNLKTAIDDHAWCVRGSMQESVY